jgi:hypothetical protein
MTSRRRLALMRTAKKSPVLALMSLEPVVEGVNHDIEPCDRCP